MPSQHPTLPREEGLFTDGDLESKEVMHIDTAILLFKGLELIFVQVVLFHILIVRKRLGYLDDLVNEAADKCALHPLGAKLLKAAADTHIAVARCKERSQNRLIGNIINRFAEIFILV